MQTKKKGRFRKTMEFSTYTVIGNNFSAVIKKSPVENNVFLRYRKQAKEKGRSRKTMEFSMDVVIGCEFEESPIQKPCIFMV